jgi:hypothetical protein
MVKPLLVGFLPVTKQHKLKVVVWKHKKDMLRSGKYSDYKTEAFFRAPRIRIKVYRTGRMLIRNNIVGEIHLVHKRFGSNIVSHELQHFIQHWISINCLEPNGKDWEKVAYLAGDLTAAFWTWFYKISGVEAH